MSYDLRITVYNNRDYEQSFSLLGADGTALNLTGCKLIFGIADSTKVMTTHDSSSTTNNKCIFITDALTGAIKLNLPYLVLKSFAPATYTHDLILVDANGKRSGIWSGQMMVKKGVA